MLCQQWLLLTTTEGCKITKNQFLCAFLHTLCSTLEYPFQFVQRLQSCISTNIMNLTKWLSFMLLQQIDGEALLMMAQNDLVQYMEMKLGPAIKLYNSIVLLRQRIRQSWEERNHKCVQSSGIWHHVVWCLSTKLHNAMFSTPRTPHFVCIMLLHSVSCPS